MSHDPSRKQFFAKLLGAAAAVTAAPGLLAKTASVVSPASDSSHSAALPLAVRPEVRAVARRAGSV